MQWCLRNEHTMNENEREFFKVFEPQKYAAQDSLAFTAKCFCVSNLIGAF